MGQNNTEHVTTSYAYKFLDLQSNSDITERLHVTNIVGEKEG
jgi:hypothetical protein